MTSINRLVKNKKRGWEARMIPALLQPFIELPCQLSHKYQPPKLVDLAFNCKLYIKE